MKKFLILTAFIIFSLQAQAYDDYIMTSDKPVKSVKSSDESVVKIRPVFTIDNNKQTIIITPQKKGKAEITVNLVDKDVTVIVEITQEQTIFKADNDFAFFTMDIPDEAIEVLPPPDIRENSSMDDADKSQKKGAE